MTKDIFKKYQEEIYSEVKSFKWFKDNLYCMEYPEIDKKHESTLLLEIEEFLNKVNEENYLYIDSLAEYTGYSEPQKVLITKGKLCVYYKASLELYLPGYKFVSR